MLYGNTLASLLGVVNRCCSSVFRLLLAITFVNLFIDETDIVHFVEVCYCLEGGLHPVAMEIPVLNKYFEDIIEVKDAWLRDQCTMECEFCDCTRNMKLPGKSLVNELNLNKGKEEQLGAQNPYFCTIASNLCRRIMYYTY
jgi:hypothetical protein